jgi:hypothetical protein
MRRILQLFEYRAYTRTGALFMAIFLIFASAPVYAKRPAPRRQIETAQTLTILPILPVAVAPNQPEVLPGSTKGIINAVCEVGLNIVGCIFRPQIGKITCDTNGDGVPELMIPLTNVTSVNGLLVQATIPALSPDLPGTPFPLSCCGGLATLTLSRTVLASPDNIFGEFTQSITCPIELGERAPVVVSASPSGGSCSIGQNLLIPGSCFVRADGTPNVTSVFAVERNNPTHVVQSSKWAILSPNLIDAFFEFGSVNAGKTYLIFVSGPNGTSRNLSVLPAGADSSCPIGNEQGIVVTFTCSSVAPPPPPADQIPPTVGICRLERSESGALSLVIVADRIRSNATITVGGLIPKKLTFKDPTLEADTFQKVVAKGTKVCRGLPGAIVITNAGEAPRTFLCNQQCEP